MSDIITLTILGFYFLGLTTFVYAILTAEMHDDDEDWDEKTY